MLLRVYSCCVFLLLSFALRAQRLTGQVLSGSDQKPMAGVSIQLKGTGEGTVTDASGKFSIQAPPKSVLIFSFEGFEQLEWTVRGTAPIRVVMTSATKALGDIVVVGYGTQQKKDLTGSIAKVDGEELHSLPAPDIGEALEGRAAGVETISSGAPGSNVSFLIRGIGTINDASPLIVVDGVPEDAPVNNLNPGDIASVEVLKDASAAAIYGSRGANGVILITTRKGVAGQGHLSFGFFAGFQSPTSVVKMLNASQYAQLNNEMLTNNGLTPNPAYANPDTLGKGTDWLGALLRKGAPMQQYFLSYSGGAGKSTFYVSGSVLNQQGIVINTAYRRYTVQLNSESQVFRTLTFGENVTLTSDEKPSGSYNIQNTLAANPVQPIYNSDGTFSNGGGGIVPLVNNPIGMATINQNNTRSYDALGSVYGEWTILPYLKFRSTAGIQAQFYDTRNWTPQYNLQPTPQDTSALGQQYNKSITWLLDNYLTFDKTFPRAGHLTVLAGMESQDNQYNFVSAYGYIPTGEPAQLINNSGGNTINGDESEWALVSYLARANYSWENKYLLTATVRRDGSSKFGENNKWGTFPSASAAWRISQESFFKDVHFVNDLKIRIGYGVTGNQSFNGNNYPFASVLTPNLYVFNNNPVAGVVAQQIPNPNVKWETVAQTNIGLDAALFHSRLDLTIDGYWKNTSNMLVPESVPITSGYSDIIVPVINAGEVQNRGIELTVTSHNLNGTLDWTTNFNISYNQNKIVSLNSTTPYVPPGSSIGLNGNLAIDAVGHPINEFYGYKTAGIFQNQEQVNNWAVQSPGTSSQNGTAPGDIKFKDLNNDGVINASDQTYIGNPNPPVIFAMNNTFLYKGIDLSIFLQGVAGNKIFNANNIYQEAMSTDQNQTAYVLGRWEGEGTSNSIPRAIYSDPNNNERISDRFVESGSYLRIKSVTLGYTLPEDLIRRWRFSRVRVYASCLNLFTFTKYTGFDPEVGATGVDFSVYPVYRTLSVGINLSL